MKLTTINSSGNKGSITISDSIFVGEINQELLARAVRVYLSNKRQGTAKTQTRSDVTRTTKKWYRQKGTGNARHGAKSANLFVGGAVAFGPRGNQNWKLKLTKKMKKLAFIQALKAQKENIIVDDRIDTLSGKTKAAVEILSKLIKEGEKTLVITTSGSDLIGRSLSNLPMVLLTHPNYVNILDLAIADKIVVTTDALKVLEKRILSEIVKVSKSPAAVKIKPSKVKQKEVKKSSKPAAEKKTNIKKVEKTKVTKEKKETKKVSTKKK